MSKISKQKARFSDFISLSDEKKLSFLFLLSEALDISEEALQSLFILYGDDLFFLFLTFSGQEVVFPTEKVLRRLYNKIVKES